jgi:hypothetical protein
MKVAWRVLVSLVLLQGIAFAQIQAPAQAPAPAPEIEVVDGKISMSALSMPLSRVVSLLDRAMGLKSKVAPEAASRPISVRFKDLPLKDAVRKIFEGQPLNYSLIEGKGIEVSGVALGGGTTATAGSPFPEAAPLTQTPLPGASPIQPAVPINAAGQPIQGATPLGVTGNPANPNPAATNTAPAGAVAPGQLPPAIGGVNPLTQPVGAPAVGTAAPAVGFPLATPTPQQPTGPGTVGGATPNGATPGVVATPGQIPR